MLKPVHPDETIMMQLTLISGMSGSGKSIALNVLEDAGYYCVDNLPAPLLLPLVEQLRGEGYKHVAVAMDMRGGASFIVLPEQLVGLRNHRVEISFIFLDARDDVLIQRFSETRRRHPLADHATTLAEAIALERAGLAEIVTLGHRIDTSNLLPNMLRVFVRDFIALAAAPSHEQGLVMLFESFGFKHGLPLDADLVFDVRCLANPFYDPQLRPLSGRDTAVVEFLEAQPDVMRMAGDIQRFIADWLPSYQRDSRAYLTIAIGCTGGQHRSVYLAERLAGEFRDAAQILVRHRALKQ